MTTRDILGTGQALELFEAVASLRSAEECRAFLRDLCTIGELGSMVERFQMAKMVYNKVPYRQISEATGCSTATITRVAHWLHHGAGGYESVLAANG